MSEENPYQAPAAELVAPSEGFSDNRLATRGSRFAAVMVDTLILGVMAIPFLIFMQSAKTLGYAISGVLGLGYSITTILFVARYGQTIGKRVMKIRIERLDGTVASFWRIILLRAGVVGLLGLIPVVGSLISIVDALMIFAQDRRCLHDRIADTVVMQVPLDAP